MAVFGLGVMLGPILGPTLGGWRWAFYVNVPFGVISALGILLFLGRRADRPLAGRLDWLGFATPGSASEHCSSFSIAASGSTSSLRTRSRSR
jgi:DHA2 family multidrug resistance protein